MLKNERGRLLSDHYNRISPKFQAGQDFLRGQFEEETEFSSVLAFAISNPFLIKVSP
jgi:hypothetical protein